MTNKVVPAHVTLQSMQSREIQLTQGRIQYRECGPADAPVVLFVHGVLANSRLWEKVAERLKVDYRCILPDWPLGAHALPMNKDADITPKGMVSIIKEFMDTLGIQKATLVGNDSGGALSQMMVAKHPEYVERLVLTSSDAYRVWLPWLFKYLEFSAFIPGMLLLLGLSMKIRLLRRMPIAFGWLSKRIPRDVSDAFAAPLAQSAGVRRDVGKFLRAIEPRYTLKAAESFPEFKSPVLIAWSLEDKLFNPQLARRLSYDFPDARLEFVDDAYTFSGIDNPEKLASIMKTFFVETDVDELQAEPAAVNGQLQ